MDLGIFSMKDAMKIWISAFWKWQDSLAQMSKHGIGMLKMSHMEKDLENAEYNSNSTALAYVRPA